MYAPRIRREIGGTGPSHGPSIPAHPGPSVDDAALKKLFSHPRMIELLIRRHVPQWDGKIDYSTLERLPAELIDEHLRRRYPDMMRRARTIDRLEEAMTMATVETEFRRGWDAVRQQGIERGIGVGQVRILRHLAARKFGRATAEELARLLGRTPDGEQISRVAAAIVDCEAADDFLARVRGNG